MSTSDDARTSAPAVDAPLTLTEPPAATLGPRDAFGLWANLGVSLLLPVAAVFVVLPGRPLSTTLGAIVVGAAIGAVLLGLAAAAGARERVPTMVLLRGLLGRRASALPTALNLVQCIGWATFEIVIIAEAASQGLDAPRWPFVLVAGVLATAMALRPLGVARVLARYAVWAALAAVVYLFVEVLSGPLPPLANGAATSFWTAADIVIALPISWFPLVADYTRHVRSGRAAFTGASLGYGLATVAMFTLGVLALAAVELDEAFANVYSTAVSTQNLVARADRRLLAVAVGTVATLLALTFDIAAYEPFLFLIGAVFVPLVGVFAVAYWSTPLGDWDTSDTAPARPLLLLSWLAGFVAYQLTLPTYLSGPGAGWTAWWTARQADLGIDPANGWSASLVGLGVAVLLTALVCLPGWLRRRRLPA